MKKLFAVFLLTALFVSFAQAAEIEKVISVTARKGMSVEGVYGNNKLYRSLFQTPAAFRKEFCRINPGKMKECSEKEFRLLQAGKPWNFPAIPEVSVINSTDQTITTQTTYTKNERGFYRLTEENIPGVGTPESVISITIHHKTNIPHIYQENLLYKSVFQTPTAFTNEVCRLNPDKVCAKTKSLTANTTWNFPAIREVYIINSTNQTVTGETIYKKDERGFYRDTARTIVDSGG